MRRARALAVGVVLLGCGDGTVSGPEVFLAFAADFRGYRGWRSADVTGTAPPGSVHPDETLTEYVDPVPPHGSSEFPVGTKVVKEPTGAGAGPIFFAMVKRGGGYNAGGAAGWEWFELQRADDGGGGVVIDWRGVGPPIGETYGGDPTSGCNVCHVACGNDAVCAPALGLSGF